MLNTQDTVSEAGKGLKYLFQRKPQNWAVRELDRCWAFKHRAKLAGSAAGEQDSQCAGHGVEDQPGSWMGLSDETQQILQCEQGKRSGLGRIITD